MRQVLGHSLRLDDDDGLVARVRVERERGTGSGHEAREAAKLRVLPRLGREGLERLGDRPRRTREMLRRRESLQQLDVSVGRVAEGRRMEDELGEDVARLLERVRPRDEVRLAVQLDQGRHAGLHVVADEPFGRHAAGLLRGGGETLLAEDLLGLLHVAVRLLERALAIEHSGARLLAEHLDHHCGNRHGIPLTSKGAGGRSASSRRPRSL